MSPLPRRSVSTGVAIRPAGSQAATPTRTDPRSTPTRAPERTAQFSIHASHLPTIQSLYDDAEIAEAQPLVPRWKDIFLNAVPRPSAPTKVAYNEVSSKFWTAVHDTLSGTGTAEENLELLQLELEEMKGGGW
jgi:trehalose/maltose transport system substrate-binding protein